MKGLTIILIFFILLLALVSPATASSNIITANSITSADSTYSTYFIGDKVIILWTYENGWDEPLNHKVTVNFDGEIQEKIFRLENRTDIFSSSFSFDTNSKSPSTYNIKLNSYVDLRHDINNMVNDGSQNIPIILLEKSVTYPLSDLIVESNVPDVHITYPLGSETTGSTKSLIIPDLLENIQYTIIASKPEYITQSKQITLGTNNLNIYFKMIKQSENPDTSIIEVAVYDLNDNRLSNANININGLNVYSMKNEYIIFTVPKGDVVVIIQKDGYLNYIKTFDATTNVRLDITLVEYTSNSLSLASINDDFAKTSNPQYIYVDLNKETIDFTDSLIINNPTKSIQTLASDPINWSIIIGAYLGAVILLFIFNEITKTSILFYGTLGWIIPLILMFTGLNPFILNYLSGSDSIYYGIINFTIYGIIFASISKKGK